MKEAVLKCILTSCMRLYSVNIIQIFGVNECKQVEGCVDADVIVGKFCDFFVKSYARRAELYNFIIYFIIL